LSLSPCRCGSTGIKGFKRVCFASHNDDDENDDDDDDANSNNNHMNNNLYSRV